MRMDLQDSPPNSLAARLKIRRYSSERPFSRDECEAALRGERIPHALGLPLLRLCMVRGIRYHPGFGEELRGIHPLFTRALNARLIMSGTVPELDYDACPEEIPYCIWYPQVPPTSTCRELVRRYPQMRYQVGRACAIGGYLDLYRELDILPEVHIAEEARESGHLDLYQEIMAAPARYNVMDDYTHTIYRENPRVGFLNGDTAVRTSLEVKQKFQHPQLSNWDDLKDPDDDDVGGLFDDPGYKKNTFNITEDMNIDEVDTEPVPATNPDQLIQLLSIPLPADLPTTDKDLLLLAAAFYGNIERYARLRRPGFIAKERQCCVRGVYHNTMFALWWANELWNCAESWALAIERAINARFIMNNVLSRVADPACRDLHLPYLIWYPTVASATTYEALARLRPVMKPQILRACIVGDYRQLFDELLPTVHPDKALEAEAKRSANPHYSVVLRKRAKEVEGGLMDVPFHERWKMGSLRDLGLGDNNVYKCLDAGLVGVGFETLYNDIQCNFSAVDMAVCMPWQWRRPRDRDDQHTELNYQDWPPGWLQSSQSD